MSKKLVQEYLKKGDNINTKVIFDDGKKFELNVKGDIKTMSDKGFSQTQLEQLGQLMDFKLNPIVQDIRDIKSRLDVLEKDVKNIESRLDVLEKDVKDIKSLPTIQKELKSQNKK